MGFLKQNHVHWTTPALLVSIAALAAGCMLLSSEPKEKRFAFSHAVHNTGQVACADCHAGAADSDEPGMPSKAQCMLCHSTLDAAKPPEKKIDSLFVDGKLVTASVSMLEDEVIFSHKRHVAAGRTCEECHTGIEQNEIVEHDLAVSMDECMACHAQNNAKNDCATCHTEINETWAPPNHAHAWTKMHGQSVRWPTGELNDRCSLCHTESTCLTCHAETPPQNHNNFFRIKGHGLAASMDRAGCAVCHKPDTCQRCHEETRPTSHTGSFGAPRDTHCLSCHFPLSDNGCAVCHKSTPSHQTATPMPSWHTPAMNCRQCHGVTESLPHVDDGSSCTMCHQ